MEDRYQHTLNGQSVLQADLNVLGETSALADDRVFAELFRMQPFDGATVRKGVLPYAHRASGATGLVVPNGASGSVRINPFRAFVGSRTAVATDAKRNWRDIRSALAVGSTTLGQVVSFVANGSGNPRWDLVYAAVAVDANTASVTRKRKNPTTKVITSASVVTRLATTVTLGVQAGTPAASPVWPAVPSDAGGVYYVPLAYVRIPNGFGASSIVLASDIAVQAPVLRLSPATGGRSLGVANSHHALNTAQQQAWGASGTAPNRWFPPDVSGGETLIALIDATSASSSDWSHANNAVVDSRDWRNRLCKATVRVEYFAFGGPFNLNPVRYGTPRPHHATFLTSTAHDDVVSDRSHVVDFIAGDGQSEPGWPEHNNLALGSNMVLYVDHADGGKLKVGITGTPLAFLACWLEFSGVIA